MFEGESNQLTSSETPIRSKCLNVSFDLQNLVDVEERRRGSLAVVLAANSMENHREILVRKIGRVEVIIRELLVCTSLQFVCIESFVREFQYSSMRSEVPGELDDPRETR